MTTQHTPGPWTVDQCPAATGAITVRPADGTEHGDTDAQPIATVYQEDHARLIAAAPELLAILRCWREWYADHFEDFSSEINSQLLCLDNDSTYAIAKATTA